MNALHHSTSIPGLALLTCLILLAACGESPTQLPTADVAAQLARGGEKGKPKPEDPPGDPDYSILDLGEIYPGRGAAVKDIINSGLMVGGIDDGPALFNASGESFPFGTVGASGSYLSEMGAFAVGNNEETRTPFRWTLSGTTDLQTLSFVETDLRTLNVDGALSLYAKVRAVNDLGQAAGESFYGDGTRTAIIWEDNADQTITPLPHLPGSNQAWARAMNNSGHVVGKSFFDLSKGEWSHAVLWIKISDQYIVVDLGGVDDTGGSSADWVSDVSGGFITLAGYSNKNVATFWTVDVAKGEVVETFRFQDKVYARDVNAGGDVVGEGELVWNWLGGPSSTLPGFDDRCGEPYGRRINDAGTVIGYRKVFVSTGRGKNTGYCGQQVMIWTKIDP